MIDATIAIDQQGVWEAAPSRDSALATTTMQQVIPEDCDEWHNAKVVHPQTFIGASANLAGGKTASISSAVLPPTFEGGWVGVGIGYQAHAGDAIKPGDNVFAYWINGSWAFGGKHGAVVPPSDQDTWVTLGVTIDGTDTTSASINGKIVASVPSPDYAATMVDRCKGDSDCGTRGNGDRGPPNPGTGAFAYLAASWSAPMMMRDGPGRHQGASSQRGGDGGVAVASFSNSEFKSVQVNITASVLPQPTPPAPPAPPSPGPGPSPPSPGKFHVNQLSLFAT